MEGDDRGEAYTTIVWGVGLSHEMAISQGPRRSMVSKATCAASSCEAPSPCRGLRPHHARKDRVGTWETSSGPQSLWRSRAAAGRRGAEAAVEQARSSDEPRSTGEAPEQGRDERRRRAWREGGSVGGMADDWRCSGRRTGPGILYPSPACGSALRSNLRARPIAPDLRQEPGAGKPHAGICAGGREKSLSLPRRAPGEAGAIQPVQIRSG